MLSFNGSYAVYILILNGVYDILCAFCILCTGNNIISSLHITMFKNEEHINNPIFRRLLAYWLLTYGAVRVAAGMYNNNNEMNMIGAYTYFIEALCFQYENVIGKGMVRWKAIFVSVASSALGIIVIVRK